MATKEQMKEEGIKRLKLLQMSPEVITLFVEKNKLYCSFRRGNSQASLIRLDERPNWESMVYDLETKYNIKVYHTLFFVQSGCAIFDCLYISSDESTWESDCEDLKRGYINDYAFNFSMNLAEFGSGKYELCNRALIKNH